MAASRERVVMVSEDQPDRAARTPAPRRPFLRIGLGVFFALLAAATFLERLPGEEAPDPVTAPTTEAAQQAFAATLDGRGYRWIDGTQADGQLTVVVTGQDADTPEEVRRGAEADAVAALTAAFHAPGTDAERVTVRVEWPASRGTGRRVALEVQLDATTAAALDWTEPEAVRWREVWTEVERHPDLEGGQP